MATMMIMTMKTKNLIVLLCMNKADFYAVVHRQKILKKKNSNKNLLSAFSVSLNIIYFSLPLLVIYLCISKYLCHKSLDQIQHQTSRLAKESHDFQEVKMCHQHSPTPITPKASPSTWLLLTLVTMVTPQLAPLPAPAPAPTPGLVCYHPPSSCCEPWDAKLHS